MRIQRVKFFRFATGIGVLLLIVFAGGCMPSDQKNANTDIQEQKDTFTVTVDLDYQGQTQIQEVEMGGHATMPTSIPEARYYQLRWVVYKDGVEQPWDFATDTVHEDMTIYLVREDIMMQCALLNADGQGSVQIVDFTMSKGYQPQPLSRPGYTFLGWYQDRIAYKPSNGDRTDVSYTAYWAAVKEDTKVLLGTYEQDGDTKNGKEPIEWLVVDRSEDGRAYYLISRYILDWRSFDTRSSFTGMWADCELRTWLNGSFMESAFSAEERDAIRETTLEDTNTKDSVFLMAHEDSRLLIRDEYRVGLLTPYAQQKERVSPSSSRAQLGSYRGFGFWMRSGQGGTNAGVLDAYASIGSMPNKGNYVKSEGVRPAMWVDVSYIDSLLK